MLVPDIYLIFKVNEKMLFSVIIWLHGVIPLNNICDNCECEQNKYEYSTIFGISISYHKS